MKVINEMKNRGYTIDQQWIDPSYRGKSCKRDSLDVFLEELYDYPEHNVEYLKECLMNLAGKDIVIDEVKIRK